MKIRFISYHTMVIIMLLGLVVCCIGTKLRGDIDVRSPLGLIIIGLWVISSIIGFISIIRDHREFRELLQNNTPVPTPTIKYTPPTPTPLPVYDPSNPKLPEIDI